MPDHMDEGYTRLATAIIKQARSDYQSTGKRLMRNMYKRSETKMADYRVFDSCLRFFQRSCNGFVDADGADILKSLNKKYGIDLDTINKNILDVKDAEEGAKAKK